MIFLFTITAPTAGLGEEKPSEANACSTAIVINFEEVKSDLGKLELPMKRLPNHL